MATHHKLTKGSDMTSHHWQQYMLPETLRDETNIFTSNDETHLSTAYYNNTTPPSYITPLSPMASYML
jgi:hypothetical protein